MPEPSQLHNGSESGIVVHMSEISVSEAAHRMRISDRRVRELAATGRIPARKVGAYWIVDVDAENSRRPRGRPMAPHVAWNLLNVLAPPAEFDGSAKGSYHPRPSSISDMSIADASRLIKRLRRWLDELTPDGCDRLRDWVVSRAQRVELAVARADIESLRSDPRIVLSGISDERSGMSAAGHVCGYVDPGDFAKLRDDYLLSSESHSPNTVLYISDHQFVESGPIPLAVVVADLLDGDIRERGQARRTLMDIRGMWRL